MGTSSDSRVYQFGFYLLNSVGLQNLINAEMKVQNKNKNKKVMISVSKTSNSKTHGSFQDGFLELLQKALRFLAEARTCSPQQLISKILFSLAETLGETLDKPSQQDLERAVNEAVRQVQQNSNHKLPSSCITLDRSVSGLIVSYHEHDEICIPISKVSRVKRAMHFNIPLKRFDATVEFPKQVPRHLKRLIEKGRQRSHKKARNNKDSSQYLLDFFEDQDFKSRVGADYRVLENPPCSPYSFPPSPLSRSEVISHFEEHTQNVLYRVRDELRGAEQRNDRARKATFNILDTHDDIVLSKGGHCCSTRCKIRSFCSTRAILSIQINESVATYFEFEIGELGSAKGRKLCSKVCVGLSTRNLPLSCLTGSIRCSVGMNTVGKILKEGRCLNGIFRSQKTACINSNDIVGVCTRLHSIDFERGIYSIAVAFFINGKRVVSESKTKSGNAEELVLVIPKNERELFPTVTLYSQEASVICRFAAQDMSYYAYDSPSSPKSQYWLEVKEFVGARSLVALDGNFVY